MCRSKASHGEVPRSWSSSQPFWACSRVRTVSDDSDDPITKMIRRELPLWLRGPNFAIHDRSTAQARSILHSTPHHRNARHSWCNIDTCSSYHWPFRRQNHKPKNAAIDITRWLCSWDDHCGSDPVK